MALHSKGYTHTIKHISTPRTLTSDARDGLRIPKAAVKALRANLREVYPDLATKDFSATRFCWYAPPPFDFLLRIGRLCGDFRMF